MKKTILTAMALLLLSVSAVFAGDPPKAEGTKSMTFQALREKYGDDIVLDGKQHADADLIQVEFAPPPGDCAGQPCEAAIPAAVRRLQRDANACCCSFAYGVLCCENGNLVEYLILIEPTNCN